MGSIVYGSDIRTIPVADEALSYIKAIAIMKLRRNESFTITYPRPDRGRASIWVHPAVSLQFVFDDPASSALDRAHLERLMSEVNSTGDLKTAHGAST